MKSIFTFCVVALALSHVSASSFTAVGGVHCDLMTLDLTTAEPLQAGVVLTAVDRDDSVVFVGEDQTLNYVITIKKDQSQLETAVAVKNSDIVQTTVSGFNGQGVGATITKVDALNGYVNKFVNVTCALK